jgi:alanyl-tRNA synthetase
MTSRLYYSDSYLTTFEGRITNIADGGKRIYLDRSAFYPTSGGQPFDLGTLAGGAVADVVDEEERIAHLLADPITAHAVGDVVHGTVDWRRRFDHMQQHTGQHLLTAVFVELFGYETVSVHFGDDRSSLDLDVGALTPAELISAERRANEIIWENRPVTVTFEDSATATGLRKSGPQGRSARSFCAERSACESRLESTSCAAGASFVRHEPTTRCCRDSRCRSRHPSPRRLRWSSRRGSSYAMR